MQEKRAFGGAWGFFLGATQNRGYAVYCPYNAILLGADMMEGYFTLTPDMIWDGKARERKRTPEEIAERVARLDDWFEEMRKLEAEDPLPDDFIEYCKGRK
jgi:hypothetical protein